jgi:uncharacterized SAM-binding protein YcdF (DUF218 family)
MALERLRYGVHLARQSGLPILLSGGAPYGGTPEAELMQRALKEDFGLGARWQEKTSRDTTENAQESVRILRAAGVSRVLLVTHALHMPRAQAAFAAVEMEVIAAPTGFYDGDADAAFFTRWKIAIGSVCHIDRWAWWHWAGKFRSRQKVILQPSAVSMLAICHHNHGFAL